MKTKNIFWAALSMTAALVMTACSEDMMTETPQAPSTSKIIPYTVTVNDGATTRATVENDLKTLYFADGDKLYITGTDIKGVLYIQSGTGTANATFSGDLTYSGSGSPASDLALTATLVSAQQSDGAEVTINATTGAVTVNYPDDAYCTSVNDAVQKYSRLTGTSTYGAKSFTLEQQTAFLNFVITFIDGTATNTPLTAVVKNGATQMASATVTTTTESEKVVAKFVLPVAKGTVLSSATVTMGSKAAISFGASQTLGGQVYNVKKLYLSGLLTGKFSVSATKQVQFSKGNLQYTRNGATWDNTGTWSFMENQWTIVESNNQNYDYTSYGVVGLFGWGTAGHSFASGYGTAYQPWATIKNTETEYYYGPTDGTSSLSGTYAQGDWGTNAISNGGNTANSGWRTLTKDEWVWLLGPNPETSTPNPGTDCRTSSTIGGTANARWVKAFVRGKNGLIIFPDEITWNATTMGDTPTTINTKGGTYNSYHPSNSQWSALESAGCVFLPTAGNRAGTYVHNSTDQGTYWSSTRDSPGGALRIFFSNAGVVPDNPDATSNGKSVRLVHDAN